MIHQGGLYRQVPATNWTLLTPKVHVIQQAIIVQICTFGSEGVNNQPHTHQMYT